MHIAIASDHRGFELRKNVAARLSELGHTPHDLGPHRKESVDYPPYVAQVTETVVSGACERGILICGTGVAMSMAANKVLGIRAALCNDLLSARQSRADTDANVLCLGSDIIGEQLALAIVEMWLATEFSGAERHRRRIAGIRELELANLAVHGFRILELSHELYPGEEEYCLEVENHGVDYFQPGYPHPPDVWYIMSDVHLWSHVGTHMESPYHYVKEGGDVASIPLSRVVGLAALVDFSDKGVGEAITRSELEERGSHIQRGDIVFVRTGVSHNYRTPRSHDRPYFSEEAIQWLVEKGVSCLGVDCSGIEKRGEPRQPNHQTLFANGIPLIEHLDRLDQLTSARFLVVAAPLRVHKLDACPLAVIAFELKQGPGHGQALPSQGRGGGPTGGSAAP